MSKYAMEQPAKTKSRAKKLKEPPPPPVFIDVVEVSTADLGHFDETPWSALVDAVGSDARLLLRRVELGDAKARPPFNYSWLRERKSDGAWTLFIRN